MARSIPRPSPDCASSEGDVSDDLQWSPRDAVGAPSRSQGINYINAWASKPATDGDGIGPTESRLLKYAGPPRSILATALVSRYW